MVGAQARLQTIEERTGRKEMETVNGERLDLKWKREMVAAQEKYNLVSKKFIFLLLQKSHVSG